MSHCHTGHDEPPKAPEPVTVPEPKPEPVKPKAKRTPKR